MTSQPAAQAAGAGFPKSTELKANIYINWPVGKHKAYHFILVKFNLNTLMNQLVDNLLKIVQNKALEVLT